MLESGRVISVLGGAANDRYVQNGAGSRLTAFRSLRIKNGRQFRGGFNSQVAV